MQSLRARQKEQRRQRLMDAAERLIRATGSTEFAMTHVAEGAEVSATTPYNLFGSKVALLYALLNRSMDRVDTIGETLDAESDAVRKLLTAADSVAHLFAADPRFYRPLLQVLVGVEDPVHRPAFMNRGLNYWMRAVGGFFVPERKPFLIQPVDLARNIEIYFVGVLDLWIQKELSDAAFCAQTVFGAAWMVMPVVGPKELARLKRQLSGSRKLLPQGFSITA